MVGSPEGNDPFDLDRFVAAQNPVYRTVVAELRRGRKTTHWIWFIFPQHKALGHSAMALRYGIGSLAEASAYLAHPLLGERLRECCRLLLDCGETAIERILPGPDDLKLRSSMTLFAAASDDRNPEANTLFQAVLDRFFNGKPDGMTLDLLPR